MRWILGWAISGFIACSSSVGNAAEIKSFEIDADTVAITVEGEIFAGDAEKFRREAAKHDSAMVLLESAGGSTYDAIQIGEAIRLRGFSTLVVNGSYCASACGLIWLAGTPRVLTQSAMIGFHATYSDESGQRLESGVGNALVGRYFAILNLPMKAIIFASEAGPSEMNWLRRDNLDEVGIETRLIDDFETEPNSSESSRGDRVAEGPAVSQSKSSSPTELWQEVGFWSVMVDRTIGDSCFITSRFYDGTSFRIGFDRSGDFRSYVVLVNEAWSSLKLGETHQITFEFDDMGPWTANASVINLSGGPALHVEFSDNKFWGEFASASALTIKRGELRVAQLSLDRSEDALDAAIACQKRYNQIWDGRDPFAN